MSSFSVLILVMHAGVGQYAYMNKDEFKAVMRNVRDGHLSHKLMRAIYGKALFNTARLVGSEKLLAMSTRELGTMNHTANK